MIASTQSEAVTEKAVRGPYKTPVSDSPRPFGYYWIQVAHGDEWIVGFWYEGTATFPGYFDCTNSLDSKSRLVRDPFAIGALLEPLAYDQTVPENTPRRGFHWVQTDVWSDWVVALWRDEPYEHRGVIGHGYFDARNWWDSGVHIIPNPYAVAPSLTPF